VPKLGAQVSDRMRHRAAPNETLERLTEGRGPVAVIGARRVLSMEVRDQDRFGLLGLPGQSGRLREHGSPKSTRGSRVAIAADSPAAQASSLAAPG
jgi:hypothetical protein